MCRAGEAAFRLLRELWPSTQRIVVVCGGGNNGGDGFVIARLAKVAELEARVAAVVDVRRLKADALRAYKDCSAAGVSIGLFEPKILVTADVIVDALFGIGLDRDLDATMTDCIK